MIKAAKKIYMMSQMHDTDLEIILWVTRNFLRAKESIFSQPHA